MTIPNETLWRVECKLKVGAGIRGAQWYEHAAYLTESEAEKYVHAKRLSLSSSDQTHFWRIAPMKVHVKYHGPAKLPNAGKGLQRAYQMAVKEDLENNTGFNGQFSPLKGGGIRIHLGGAR
jgi:hypothetical protein